MDSLNNCLENIFLLLQEFFDFLEQSTCYDIIGADVADIFLKAANIESVCAYMNSSGLAEEFNDKLQEFWLVMGKENGPELDYFKFASDLALKKYLMYEKFDDVKIKLALDFYLKNNNKDKLILVIQDLVESHQIFSSLSRIAMNNVSILEIKSRIIFESWKHTLSLNCASFDVIHESVTKLINEDVNNVKLLLKMLCFENKSNHSVLVKDIVLANVLVLLGNGFVKDLWTLFLNTEENDFKYLLKNYREILNLIYEIVKVSAQNLKISYSVSDYEWIENEFSSCLSYSEVIVLLKKVKCVGDEIEKELGEYLLRRKSGEFCIFFEDVLRDLG